MSLKLKQLNGVLAVLLSTALIIMTSNGFAAPTAPAATAVTKPSECHFCTLLTKAQDKAVYDDPAKCAGKNAEGKPFNKNYLANSLKQVPAMYRLPRAKVSEAEFPKECIQTIMSNFPDSAKMYASCSSVSATPAPGAGRHCMTSEYVNTVYNSFVDVMDCLDVDQMIFLPKLLNESGFHINAFNSKGFDSGVGQLTKSALSDVNLNGHVRYVKKIQESNKPSCQRLTKVGGLMNQASVDSAKRCELISAPMNPVRNILYTAMTALRLRQIVENSLRKAEIDSLFVEGGFGNYDREKLIETLSILGYNTGGGTAVRFLKDYLQVRVEKLKQGKGKKLAASDFDFMANSEKDLEVRATIAKEYKIARVAAKEQATAQGLAEESDETQKLVGEAIGKIHKTLLKKIDSEGIQNLSFPVYAMYAQNLGAYGYGTFIAANKKLLDSKMGVGKCSPKHFLSF